MLFRSRGDQGEYAHAVDDDATELEEQGERVPDVLRFGFVRRRGLCGVVSVVARVDGRGDGLLSDVGMSVRKRAFGHGQPYQSVFHNRTKRPAIRFAFSWRTT